MTATCVVGVDPGLVHTGAVALAFEPSTRAVTVKHEAIAGPDAVRLAEWVDNELPYVMGASFVEGYRPRSHFDTDSRMVNAVHRMRDTLGSKILMNTGVKKVVRRPLMELLGCWKFTTVTNHQDLRSAARILLLGMLKDEHHNRLLAGVVEDHLAGRTWRVVHH